MTPVKYFKMKLIKLQICSKVTELTFQLFTPTEIPQRTAGLSQASVASPFTYLFEVSKISFCHVGKTQETLCRFAYETYILLTKVG